MINSAPSIDMLIGHECRNIRLVLRQFMRERNVGRLASVQELSPVSVDEDKTIWVRRQAR
jgi:hypothetical protein